MRIRSYNTRPDSHVTLELDYLEAACGVIQSGRYILGPELEALERGVAEHIGVNHAVGVGSGTDALVFSLESLRIGRGSEVITSAFTFSATALPILRLGATPVFCDIDPKTFNLDPHKLERLITSRTRAIVPVHLFGLMADMRRINEIADRHAIPVVEDACQAFGAEIDGMPAGSWGIASAFSFYPTKPLGGIGDGGMLVTNDDTIAERTRALRNLGLSRGEPKYSDRIVGYKSRLDEIQAAVLRVKLHHLSRTEAQRLAIADRYDAALKDRAEITTPSCSDERKHVFHQYTIRLPRKLRDSVYRKMLDRGIGVSIYYPKPLPNLRPFLTDDCSVATAHEICSEVLSLPIWPGMTRDETDTVTDELRRVLGP